MTRYTDTLTKCFDVSLALGNPRLAEVNCREPYLEHGGLVKASEVVQLSDYASNTPSHLECMVCLQDGVRVLRFLVPWHIEVW